MLSVSALRRRLALSIHTAMGADGWRESAVVYDQFPGDTADSAAHKGYAVGSPRSSVIGSNRQRVSEGVLVETTVRVRWCWHLAALEQVGTYDDGLDQEALLIQALFASARTDLHIYLVDTTRTVDDQGWLTGDLSLRCLHHLALS